MGTTDEFLLCTRSPHHPIRCVNPRLWRELILRVPDYSMRVLALATSTTVHYCKPSYSTARIASHDVVSMSI